MKQENQETTWLSTNEAKTLIDYLEAVTLLIQSQPPSFSIENACMPALSPSIAAKFAGYLRSQGLAESPPKAETYIRPI